MRRLIIASMHGSAGKTSVIVGLGRAMKKRIGYLKPFGDRLLYRKKRLWDYDAALVANIFKLDDHPEEMSIGFDHSKLRFMYDEESTKIKLEEMLSEIEGDRDQIFIEGGRNIRYGVSVNLDSISLAKYTGARMIIVIGGDEGVIMDDLAFIHKRLDTSGIDFGGIIINKVHDIEDFKITHGDTLAEIGIPVLGILPYQDELELVTARFVADALFAKVIAGEEGLDRQVKEIFVGAMSTASAIRNPFFGKKDKLVITSGDRSDMILAALDGETSGIVLTNNIYPPANIISQAMEQGVPLMVAAPDTFKVAKQVDDLDRLLTKEESGKIELLERMVAENIDLGAFDA
jgi:uncharacterized protein